MKPSQYRVDAVLAFSVLAALAGTLQFVAMVTVASGSYAGGTRENAKAIGYSWSGNWISDLGRMTAWNNMPNESCATIFNGSVIFLGATLVLFFITTLRATEEFSYTGLAATLSGVVSAAGLIGIGLTPFDQFHDLHIAALLMWILPMLVAAASFSIQAVRSGGTLGILIAISSCVLVSGTVVYALSRASSSVMAVQKLVVVLSIVWFALLISRVALAAIYVIVDNRSRLQVVNKQAGEYMKRIEKGHLRPFQKFDD